MARDNRDIGDEKDCKVFIRSQRAGRLQHGDAFSFRCPTDGAMREPIEREQLYFDTNASLPLHWASLVNSCRHSSSSREFEFGMVVTEAEDRDDARFSHADELFYKGQLLPLQLQPRLQMVEKLLYENQQEKADDDHDSSSVFQGTVPEPFSNLSSANLAGLFQPSYSKVCVNSADVVAIETATDSGSSSFQSHVGSFWESAADNSSRDSNDSSQDDCFASNEFDNSKNAPKPVVKSSKEPPFLHNREVFSTQSKLQEQSTFSSWLRPFKWNVLFGVKRASKPIQEQNSEAQSTQQNRFSESYFAFPPAPHLNVPPCSPSQLGSTEQTWSADSGQAASVTSTTAEDQPVTATDRERRESRSYPYNLPAKNGANGVITSESDNEGGPENETASEFCQSHSTAASGTAEERLSNVGAGERSKVRDRWMKYIKMLKPLYGKMPPRMLDLVKIDNVRTSAPTILLPRRATSLPFIKPAEKFKSVSQKSLSGSLSFLSQTSRIAYIGAPRKSNASDSGVLLQPLSQSMISDLQTSLQVAIAHCKQSHSTRQQLEDP